MSDLAGPRDPVPAPTPRRDGRGRVIAALSGAGALSRAELSRQTSMAPSTITALVAQLLEEGLVVEREERATNGRATRLGRPGTLVSLHRSAGVVVGIDVGRRHVRVAVCDRAHELLAERAISLDPDESAGRHVELAAGLVRELLDESGLDLGQVACAGMGLPGPIIKGTGQLGDSSILPTWVGLNASAVMSDALGIPVVVNNDANLGALGEWVWGDARGSEVLVFVKASTGIGAGIMLDGRLFDGYGGTAGELGHTIVDPRGPICRCGNRGCLEMLAGGPAVLDSLRPVRPDLASLGDVIAAARAGDPGCARALGDSGRAIGTALATLCNLINPRRIVVGGELAAAGDLLLDPMREAMIGAAIRSAGQDVQLGLSKLGPRAGVLGAAALALTELHHEI